jgi:hypothetical protein
MVGGLKFDRAAWADKAKGTIIYTGDKVKFQNGFGAWQHMIYHCEFDPATKSIVDVEVAPRG